MNEKHNHTQGRDKGCPYGDGGACVEDAPEDLVVHVLDIILGDELPLDYTLAGVVHTRSEVRA